MYLMYVDESGDVGMARSPTQYFTLTGIIIHELRWNEYMERLIVFRKRMRRFNPIPNQQAHGPGYRNIRIGNLVEDPYFKDSRDSYFVQTADLAAFLLYQKFAPSSYIKRKHAQTYFNRLRPVLCTVASTLDPDGIVRL